MLARYLKITGVTALVCGVAIYWSQRYEEASEMTNAEPQEELGASEESLLAKNASPDLMLIDSSTPVVAKPVIDHPEMLVMTGQIGGENLDGEVDLSILSDVFQQFKHVLGSLPNGGWNEAIVAELLGGNQKRIAFLAKDHPQISPNGALLDRYGTPYNFHPVSASLIEIRSAGPDKILFNDDDHVRD